MSIKSNFFYNSISGTMQYIVLLLTMPYVSRILGVSNYGLVSFVDSTLNFFILFASMGMNLIGVREIANSKNNTQNLNSVFSSLMVLHSIWTIFIIIIYTLIIFSIPQFLAHKNMFIIGISKLLATLFLLDWFYRGIENFKYITIRNVIVRCIYILLVFLLVKKPSDYVLYFILTISTVAINALINTLYARYFINFSLKGLKLRRLVKPFYIVGISIILSSLYTTFNVIYLGLVSTNEQVGYYTIAMKLYIIILAIFGAFTGVMLPRMSNLLASDNNDVFHMLVKKSFDMTLKFLIPTAIFSVIYASQIIAIVAGKDYIDSILPMQIIMPALILVGIAQVLAYQLFVPLKKDKILLYGSLIGAFIGVVLNISFAKKFGSTGSAIVLVCSELIVTIYYLSVTLRYSIITFSWNVFLKHIIFTIPYLIIGLFSIQYFSENIFALVFGAFSFLFVFIAQNVLIQKDPIIMNLLSTTIRKFS